MPTHTTHAVTPRRSNWRDLSEYLTYRYGVGVSLAALVLALAAGVLWYSAASSGDLRGAPEQRLEGRLTDIRFVTGAKVITYMPIAFAVGDQEFTVEPTSILPRDPLRVGDAVRVTYRVGKSGHWYVDRLERLEPVHPD